MRTHFTLKSLSTLIEFIEVELSDRDDVLFRGQRSDWSLKPKLGRLLPRNSATPVDIEERMLNSFKTRSLPHLTLIPKNEWEWLSLAQHHGMATRLLDWTTNPLSALWFAVHKPALNSEPGVLWMFLPNKEDHIGFSEMNKTEPYEYGTIKVFQPKHIAKRIASQQGWFTLHSPAPLAKTFNDMSTGKLHKDKLLKFKIPAANFSDIRFQLDRLGINALTIFNDLDGLSKDAEWQYSLLEDEDD
jgi:FRG domain